LVSVIRSQKDSIDYRLEELIVNDLCHIKLPDIKKYKVDLIIHLAAQVSGRPTDKLKNNIESTQRISSIASSLDVPIIFLSSTNVFFDDVLGSYAKSKKICEEILKNNNPKCCIIRVPLVVGLKSSSIEIIRDFYRKYSFFPLFGK
jgi:nucleoside-diphosphate-sugar epimerase